MTNRSLFNTSDVRPETIWPVTLAPNCARTRSENLTAALKYSGSIDLSTWILYTFFVQIAGRYCSPGNTLVSETARMGTNETSVSSGSS